MWRDFLHRKFLMLCAVLALLGGTNRAVICASSSTEDIDSFHLRHNMLDEGPMPSWFARIAHRVLSLSQDLFTGEYTKTVNGAVPRTSCQIGYFRPPGGTDLVSVIGPRLDGCVKCPRGRYGGAPGQTDSMCSGSCPTGRYSDVTGITDPAHCKLCPTGRFGATPGLQTQMCSGNCPAGKFSEMGSIGSSYCQDCEFNLSGHTRGCTQNMAPREPLH